MRASTTLCLERGNKLTDSFNPVMLMPLTLLSNLTKSRSLNMAPLLDACQVYGGCLPPQDLWLHRQARLHHSQGFVSTRYSIAVAQLLTGCTNPSHSASSGACLLPAHVFWLFSPTIMHNLEIPFGQDRMVLDKWQMDPCSVVVPRMLGRCWTFATHPSALASANLIADSDDEVPIPRFPNLVKCVQGKPILSTWHTRTCPHFVRMGYTH
jgi:hypothetical protein